MAAGYQEWSFILHLYFPNARLPMINFLQV